jgi:hypothetical protein
LDHFEEQASFRFPRREDGAIVAAFEHQAPQTKVHAAFEFVAFTMAIKTMGLKNRPDVSFKNRRRTSKGRENVQQQNASEAEQLAATTVVSQRHTIKPVEFTRVVYRAQ